MAATDKYMASIEALRSFSEEEAGLEVEIFTDKYPIRCVFTPSMNARQVTLDTEPDENEGKLVISLGLKTEIENSLQFSIEASVLKKLLRISEKLSYLYYHSFCELEKQKNEFERVE